MTTFITAANSTAVDLFATISTVARGATKTVNTAVATIDMLDTFVTLQLTKQQLDAKLELSAYTKVAVKKAALSAVLFDQEIKDKLISPEMQKSFNEYGAIFDAVLNPTVNP